MRYCAGDLRALQEQHAGRLSLKPGKHCACPGDEHATACRAGALLLRRLTQCGGTQLGGTHQHTRRVAFFRNGQ